MFSKYFKLPKFRKVIKSWPNVNKYYRVVRKIVCSTSKYGSIVGSVGCTFYFTTSWIGTLVFSEGDSMLPKIKDNDWLLIEKITVRLGGIRRGDVVMCRSCENPKKFIIKRVIALEGEYIGDRKNVDRDTWLNIYNKKRSLVPRGHVWLEGDYPDDSRDSRMYGPVPYGIIQGRVFFRISPLNDIGWIGNIK